MEQRSKELGETHTTARFSLQLEVDRLKRDVDRLEDELSRTRKDVGDREGTTRDREDLIHKLQLEVQQLTTQLNTQTQARLSLSEKLDSTQSGLKTAEAELFGYRTRVNELETRLSKDQRTLLSTENQYRDQLTERNTLLLTIYQYMDKILGVDKTPKKGNQAETKPFTNFSVFHDNLITRLKALSQIQLDFEKRVKDAEGKFTEKLAEMRRQLDVRWKQIDKFESSVKAYGEAKATWRRKFTAKDGEIEGLKATNAELTSQLVTARRPTQGDSQETKTLLSRAVNAEKRLVVVQNQLLLSEEKISNINQKTTAADQKWEARVKEYETRLKAGEEKYKRERQGAKERVLELENQMRSLERQNELAQKRSAQLDTVAEANKAPSRSR
jgi:chromosome segregation ATPase